MAAISILRKCKTNECEVKKVSEWISVKDRLPEKNRAVLCILKFRYGESGLRFTGLLYLDNENKWHNFFSAGDVFGLNEIYEVTHWMTLPDPPKEGQYGNSRSDKIP